MRKASGLSLNIAFLTLEDNNARNKYVAIYLLLIIKIINAPATC